MPGTAPPADSGRSVRRGRVLLADDSAVVRAIVGGALRSAGYTVDEAADGASALRLVEQDCYDVVITDLRMPAVDGFGVLESVRLRNLAPDVVILTGTHAHDISAAIRALRLGATDFLMKPLTGPDQAVLAVDRVMEKKRQREALREAQARYQHLFERVPIGLYRTTSDGQFLEANPALVEMLGCPDRETLLSLSAEHFYVNPGERRRWLEEIERTGVVSRFEKHLRRLDGRLLWVEDHSRLVASANGEGTCYEGSLLDVTERKRSDEALREREASFRLLFANNPHPMWVFDRDSLAFLEVNEAAVGRYGYSRDEFLAMRITDIRPPEEVPRLLARLATPGEGLRPPDGEAWRHRAKDGRIIEVEVASHALDFAGRRGSLVVATDITERRRLEAQLRQAQKMEAVGRLAGGVAHDFNNLLTAISGYGVLLGRDTPATDPREAKIRGILRAAEQAAGLTRQLLAFSRRQVVQPRVLDLNEVVGDMRDLLRRVISEDVELLTSFEPGLHRVEADRGQVEQIVMNLAANARDAMPQGGRVTLETTNVALDDAYARDHVGSRIGPHVRLSVSDTGCGMDRETQSHIFEPFFTTKELGKGTGLGLATVYGIVKQAGGYIWVESDVGRGTRFDVYLPRCERAAVPHRRATPSRETVGGTETVLVVEDEEIVRDLVSEALAASGYAVLVAEQPERALHVAESHSGPIHLMLTDVVMPGMSGPQLAERLRAVRPETRVLYMSGYAENAALRHEVLVPGNHFLEKPFTVASLLGKIRGLLDVA